MRRLVQVLLVALTFATPGHAQRTEAPLVPELEVTLGPEAAMSTNGYVHGQIVMNVRLLSRYPFESLDLKVPPIATAETVELMRPRTRKVTSYAGEGYVFETAVAIIPQTSGVLNIPPVTAVGHVEPIKGDERPFNLASDAVDIKIAGVSKHYRSRWWLVTDRVEIQETWSVPIEEIRVGEIVKRTISIRVWGIPAERMPPIEHPRTRGVLVSLESQNITTEKSQEGLIAVADYVWNLEAEPQQVSFIAPVGIEFWDPIEHRARRAGVKGLRLEPLPADSEKIAQQLMAEAQSRQDSTVLVAMAVLGVLALPILFGLVAFARAWLPTRSDLRLRTALSSARSSADRYNAFQRWLLDQGTAPAEFDGETSVRKRLSDHLFGAKKMDAPDDSSLRSEAFRFSRHARIRTLLARIDILR